MTCQVTDCSRAHPPRCKNPDCLVLDQGLPRWKILQCRNWHANPKSKKKTHVSRNQSQSKRKTNSYFNISDKVNWPPLPSSSGSWPNNFAKHGTVPVWQNQISSQNHWRPQQIHPNEKVSGNEPASWSTPLSRGTKLMWGNYQLEEKIHIAMELIKLMSHI